MYSTLLLHMLAMQGTSTNHWGKKKTKPFLFSIDLYPIIFHEIKSLIYYPNRLLHFGVAGYTHTRASHVVSKAQENPRELITGHCQKRVISEFVGKADFIKRQRVKLFICTQNIRMCHSAWKALENTKEGGRKTPSTPCSRSATTYEQGHLQVKDSLFSWFSSLIDKNFLTLKHQTRSSSIYTRP